VDEQVMLPIRSSVLSTASAQFPRHAVVEAAVSAGAVKEKPFCSALM
jgi:hypothetical protein